MIDKKKKELNLIVININFFNLDFKKCIFIETASTGKNKSKIIDQPIAEMKLLNGIFKEI